MFQSPIEVTASQLLKGRKDELQYLVFQSPTGATALQRRGRSGHPAKWDVSIPCWGDCIATSTAARSVTWGGWFQSPNGATALQRIQGEQFVSGEGVFQFPIEATTLHRAVRQLSDRRQ